MENGKTLIYTACKEGKIEIVQFLLNKGLNPLVKSRIGNEYESNLQVAARWNYPNIVELLLSKVDYKKEEIIETYKMNEIEKRIRRILKDFLKKKFNTNKRCGCL